MIPYDELVESLANWRQKNGMTTRQASGRQYVAATPADGTDVHSAVVPENDFERADGTGEIDLESDVVYGEEED